MLGTQGSCDAARVAQRSERRGLFHMAFSRELERLQVELVRLALIGHTPWSNQNNDSADIYRKTGGERGCHIWGMWVYLLSPGSLQYVRSMKKSMRAVHA